MQAMSLELGSANTADLSKSPSPSDPSSPDEEEGPRSSLLAGDVPEDSLPPLSKALLIRKLKKTFNKRWLFSFFLLWMTLFSAKTMDEKGELLGEEDITWPYYITHYFVALFFFEAACLTYHVLVNFFDFEGNLVCGLVAGNLWYLSREVRDHEKLGFWDWEGLLAPVFGVFVTVIPLQFGATMYRWKVEKKTKQVPVYTFGLLAAMSLAMLVLSVYYNDHFRPPYGTKSGGEPDVGHRW